MKFQHLLLLIIATLFVACDASKKVVVAPPITENRDLDTLVVSAPKPDKFKSPEEFDLPEYNPSFTREHDLLHTKLDVRFDWAKQHVIGKATLQLKAHFYPKQFLKLDAKNFAINKVATAEGGKELKYEYDKKILTIDLGREYTQKETYEIFIDYIAKPADRDGFGGSSAITSDQGLFFINHDGSDLDKPMQIWTQGETEHNSRWFPTIDKPNERCTQELYITVQDKFKTLSNGLLISSNKNSDGTRTDYWKMDQAHAPYLFMIGVGEFAVVTDNWNGIVVDYYVEPEYEKDARAIFANTLEMLDFFSEKTGVKYPWPKYSQIVVRDYVSGAMENTSAVIFGDFVQRHADELIDDNNDKIVAHEMFHHWFGDLVTCESWSNLTMNEGFANYSEYLWLEHKYGRDEADYHLLSELRGYLGEASRKIHPLIHYGYDDKEDMFDAHSYNKGGLVLHMLRKHIGDEAFWAGLNKYLIDNEYSDVEADELRLAFEDVTGQDMNWFFDQWYFKAGHPELLIDYDYDDAAKKMSVIIEQKQNTDRHPAIFDLPFSIDIYVGKASPMRKEVRMTQRKQTFTFDVKEKPALVNVDAEKMLLCDKRDNKTEEQYVFQYFNAPHFLDRFEAMKGLQNSKSEGAQSVMKAALQDPFWGIRTIALDQAPVGANLLPIYAKLLESDKHSEVRATAAEKLGEGGDKAYLSTIKKAIDNDPAIFVKSAALNALIAIDEAEALAYAKQLENSESSAMIGSVAEIYAASGDGSKLPFFEKNLEKVDGYDAISFLENHLYLAVSDSDESVARALSFIKEVALNMGQSPWRRFGATKAIAELRNEYLAAIDQNDGQKRARYMQRSDQLTGIITEIKRTETNNQLLEIYQQF